MMRSQAAQQVADPKQAKFAATRPGERPQLQLVRKVEVDRSRDALLTDFGKTTLEDRYLLPGESYQDMFARVATAYADDAAHTAALESGRIDGEILLTPKTAYDKAQPNSPLTYFEVPQLGEMTIGIVTPKGATALQGGLVAALKSREGVGCANAGAPVNLHDVRALRRDRRFVTRLVIQDGFRGLHVGQDLPPSAIKLLKRNRAHEIVRARHGVNRRQNFVHPFICRLKICGRHE